MQYRSVAKVVILTIITLGMYALFWLYWTRRDMTRYGYKLPSLIWLIGPALAFLGVILVAMVLTAASSGSSDAGSPSALSSAILLFLIITGVVVYVFSLFYPLYWFYKYCDAAAKITSNRVEFATGYVLYVVAWFTGIALPIWMAVTQDAFNKIAVSTGPTSLTTPSSSGPITTKKASK